MRTPIFIASPPPSFINCRHVISKLTVFGSSKRLLVQPVSCLGEGWGNTLARHARLLTAWVLDSHALSHARSVVAVTWSILGGKKNGLYYYVAKSRASISTTLVLLNAQINLKDSITPFLTIVSTMYSPWCLHFNFITLVCKTWNYLRLATVAFTKFPTYETMGTLLIYGEESLANFSARSDVLTGHTQITQCRSC